MISVLKRMVPELIDLSEKRYTILQNILFMQPVGRRTLASHINYGERTVRSEIEFLKEHGFIVVDPLGMKVTDEGRRILDDVKKFIYDIKGLYELETEITEILHLQKVFIVPGNADDDELVLKEMGRTAASYIKSVLHDNAVMAVTGGSTVAEVANSMSQGHLYDNVLVVPARGGIGRDVEKQASTVASIFAKKIGGYYRLLHAPDNLDKKTMDTLSKDPDIKSVLQLMHNADILVYGIGRADEMAKRRNLENEKIDMLMRKGAKAEAFGYYFNQNGQTVYSTSTLGLDIKDFENIPVVVGVAGGRQKAEAITSVTSHRKHSVLITDEGATRSIIEMFK